MKQPSFSFHVHGGSAWLLDPRVHWLCQWGAGLQLNCFMALLCLLFLLNETQRVGRPGKGRLLIKIGQYGFNTIWLSRFGARTQNVFVERCFNGPTKEGKSKLKTFQAICLFQFLISIFNVLGEKVIRRTPKPFGSIYLIWSNDKNETKTRLV